MDLKDGDGNSILQTSKNYKVKFCMKRLANDPAFLKDKVVSCTNEDPTFEYGDILLPILDGMWFADNDRVKEIEARYGLTLFNPGFRPTNIRLEVSFNKPDGTEDNDFEISWDGGYTWRDNSNPSFTFTGIPSFEHRDVGFIVRANHNPWPVEVAEPTQLRGMTITAKTQLYDLAGTPEDKETISGEIPLYLLASNEYFDLRRKDELKDITCVEEDETKTQYVGINWVADMAGDIPTDYVGTDYQTKIILKEKESGTTIREETETFTFTQELIRNDTQTGVPKELIISENLGRGEYILEYFIDFADSIPGSGVGALVELLDGIEAESNNFGKFEFNTYCTENDNEGCVAFDNLITCNKEHLDISTSNYYTCAWECAEVSCPPPTDYSSTGTCETCAHIEEIAENADGALPCYGYNNKQTCEWDSCGEGDRGCSDFFSGEGCVVDVSDYRCYWDDPDNNPLTANGECLFFYDGCNYRAKADGSCFVEGTTSVGYEITGTPITAGAICIEKNYDFPCPRRAKLPVFGIMQFAIIISLIGVVYLFSYLRRR